MAVSSLDTTLLSFPLDDRSHIGEVRRAATTLAARLGFPESDQGRLALVVTEAATNVMSHGGGGVLLLRSLQAAERSGVEVLFLDRGSGIPDLDRAFRDGHSTGGTPGSGLGAIVRQSDDFDIYSRPGQGTALFARIWPRHPGPAGEDAHPPGRRLELGAVWVPLPGETVCGDAWAVRRHGDADLLMVTDGIGHGVPAAAASSEAVRTFRTSRALEPAAILEEIHGALRSTRGATVAVALLDHRERRVHFAGVGNIAGAIVSEGESHSMVSHNGTVGHELHRLQEFSYAWPPRALVVMHSDGLQSHWQLDRYPGLARRHPGLIAGLLQRDFTRGRDDVAVLVARASE